MFNLPVWVYIGLAAQLLWVIGSIIDKYLIDKYFSSDEDESSGVGTLILFSSVFSIGISIVAALFAWEQITFSLTSSILGITIGIANAFWVLAYLHAIEDTELSRTIPIFQTIPIFGFIFSFLFLHEILTNIQMAGALIVISGAFILSYHFSTKSFAWKPFLLMLTASAIVAFQETLFKVVAIDFSYWNSAFWMGIGFSIFGLFLYTCVKEYRMQFMRILKKKSAGVWIANGTNELIDNSANLIFAFAITLGPVVLVQSINAYQPLLTLILSYLVFMLFGDFLDEDLQKSTVIQKIFGVIIISIGSILIYL